MELYLYSNKVIENVFFCLMDQSGIIESDFKILEVTKRGVNIFPFPKWGKTETV